MWSSFEFETPPKHRPFGRNNGFPYLPARRPSACGFISAPKNWMGPIEGAAPGAALH